MKKNLTRTFILIFLFCITIAAFSKEKEKEPAMASVAMIQYQNSTGSNNYDWVTNTLPEAVFNSMKEVFEFTRTSQAAVDNAIVSLKKAEFIPNAANLGAIASSSKSDIVISGIYTVDKENNILEITTFVYHASRNAITAQIKSESPINNKMFGLVDKVAVKIVDHIKVIAAEDYKNQGKTLAAEKKGEDGRPTKAQKIFLIKADPRYDYSSFYFNVSNSMIFMLGPLAQSIPYGFDLKLNFTNSYKSLYMYGGTLSYAMVFPLDEKTAFAKAGMTIIDLKVIVGLNFSIKQKVYIQPYIGFGGALQIIALQKNTPTGTNPPFKITTENQYQGDVSMSAGIRVPIRLAGYDMFITPFVEFCAFPFHNNFIGYIQAGVGISL